MAQVNEADRQQDHPHKQGGEMKKKMGQSYLGLLALLVSLMALGLILWQSRFSPARQSHQMVSSSIQKQTSINSQYRQQTDDTIGQLQSTLLQTQASLTALKHAQQAQSDRMQALTTQLEQYQSQDSVTNYLSIFPDMRATIQRSYWALTVLQDQEQAIYLLQQAIAPLRVIPGKSAERVQTQLENIIKTIRLMPSFNLSQTMKQLDVLGAQLTELKLIPSQFKPRSMVSENNEVSSSKKDSFIHRQWHKGAEQLKSLFVIRHDLDSSSVLLKPDQLIYVREHLQQKVFQAQWALLHRHADLYQNALKQIDTVLSHYFSINSLSLKKIRQGIDDLIKVNVEPKYPDYSQSMASLNNLQKSLESEQIKKIDKNTTKPSSQLKQKKLSLSHTNNSLRDRTMALPFPAPVWHGKKSVSDNNPWAHPSKMTEAV